MKMTNANKTKTLKNKKLQILEGMFNSVSSNLNPDDHKNAISILKKIDDKLEDYYKKTKALPLNVNIYDLPVSLREQLSMAKTDDLEDKIVTLINCSPDKELDIDNVIINLWRKYGSENERKFIMNRLYRMTQEGKLYSVKGKRGVYSTEYQGDTDT